MSGIQPKKTNINPPAHVWRIFVIVALATLAAVAGWLYADARTARFNESVSTATIRSLSGQIHDLVRQQETTTEAAKKTDKQIVTDAVTAYAHAYKAWAKSTIAVNTDNVKDGTTVALVPFSAQSPDGGLGCIVKKVESDNTWVVVNCGQGLPEQAVLDTFNIPSNFTQSIGAQ